jgi:hypothetical protein
VSAERGCRPDTLVAVAKGRRYGRSEGHGGTQMPRGRSGRRAERLERLEWTEEEIAVLRRAVRLHAMGMARQAAQMVAIRCPFPPELQGRHVAQAVRLDVALWVRAYTGAVWDGDAAALQAARHSAGFRRRRAGANPTTFRSDGRTAPRQYCYAHLMVESLDDHPAREECDDFADVIGWPDAFDCGTLDWQAATESARVCAFCDAMLLPSEAVPVEGAPEVVRGRHCCMSGCARNLHRTWPACSYRTLTA